MICDTLEHLSLYQGFHKNLDTAITFLTACDLNALPLGRTEVDGENVFINVMDADLQPMEGSHPEYHRLYADLQLDLTGGEGWGYETEPGTEVKPYSPDIGFKDCRVWHAGRRAVRDLLPRRAAPPRHRAARLQERTQSCRQDQNGGQVPWIRKNCLLRSRAA